MTRYSVVFDESYSTGWFRDYEYAKKIYDMAEGRAAGIIEAEFDDNENYPLI